MSIPSISPLYNLSLQLAAIMKQVAGAAATTIPGGAAGAVPAAAAPAAAPIKFNAADMLQYMNTVDENGQSTGVSDQGRVVGYMVEFYAGARIKNNPQL